MTSSSLLDAIFAHVRERPEALALQDENQSLTYRQLGQQIEQKSKYLLTLNIRHRACLLAFSANIENVVCYLACMASKVPLLLIDPETAPSLVDDYAERFALAGCFDSQGQWHALLPQAPVVRDDLALLMTTSGSTGAPKLVMLTADNVSANARSITRYLPMQAIDVGITSLPLFYSYGLSVLNTHLYIGAAFILRAPELLSPGFWDDVKHYQVSSLAGVPFSFQLLRTLRIERMALPALRYLTQAGGRLPLAEAQYFRQLCQQRNWQFFQMYGQTEATARMAYLPADCDSTYWDCIGIAIPDGELTLQDPQTGIEIKTPLTTGELVYRGPNVMLGYANEAADLRETGQLSALLTGDLAERLENGYFRITGRKSRFIKIRGKRYALDHIEHQLAGSVAEDIMVTGQDELLVVACSKETDAARISDEIKQRWHLHPRLFKVMVSSPLPRLANGKPHFARILEWAQE